MKTNQSNQVIEEIRFLFGDQLDANHSWFDKNDDSILYVLAELPQEMDYVKHHVQKIAAFLLAMRAFASELSNAGHQVVYYPLNDCLDLQDQKKDISSSLVILLAKLCEQYQPKQISFQQPDEYRLLQQLRAIQSKATVKIDIVDSEHFFIPNVELQQLFTKGKHKKMEFFYRMMRQRFNILMVDDEPEGGRWNYDSNNRNKLKPEDIANIPLPKTFSNNALEIYQLLERCNIKHFGKRKECIDWPVTRAQSLQLLDYFCDTCLPLFGKFQDAMTDQSSHAWSLYHSRLSFSLNTKLISPQEVIDAAIQKFRNSDQVNLSQIEGFVRQILGWREFVRGIYWANMPDYSTRNSLSAKNDLPDFFWTGETEMHCLKQSIGQSLTTSYAHHIQRLMIIGNYCLLAGIHPDQVDAWYLGVYADAIEWVQQPNTRGMSQFADGGIVGTKPYAASGSYVNRMSDYCKSCRFNVKQTIGENACPLNSLYWQFLERHANTLGNNPRMSLAYKNWYRKDPEERIAIIAQPLTHQ